MNKIILQALSNGDSLITLGLITVIIIAIIQLLSFRSTRNKMYMLKDFFPVTDKLQLKEVSITRETLNSEKRFRDFLNENLVWTTSTHVIANDPVSQSSDEDVDPANVPIKAVIIQIDESSGKSNAAFRETIIQTNAYLCKNTGTAADFSQLKDICENRLDSMNDMIERTLNIPLYLGLAGTFLGIITGLSGVDLDAIISAGNSTDGVQHLLYGVITAMTASLFGLILTVLNSSVNYKNALAQADNQKNNYYDYLRRELMPLLATSMSASLQALRNVLGNFIGKFGRNLDAYSDSAQLLNDNLERQHLVLQEINQLNMTKAAKTIAASFSTLQEASETLDVFKQYQKQLNQTTKDVTESLSKTDQLMSDMSEFKRGLAAIIQNQDETNELQKTFKKAIETNFPTGADARKIWRDEFDRLMEDAKAVSEAVSGQLEASTGYVRNFVNDNSSFFNSIGKLDASIDTLVKCTDSQKECYVDLKKEIHDLRSDLLDTQEKTVNLQTDTIHMNQSVLRALQDMTTASAEMAAAVNNLTSSINNIKK